MPRYDLAFRPADYRDAATPLAALTQDVLGQERRRLIADLAGGGPGGDGASGPVDDALLAAALDERTRAALGRVHPSFMGGEYLPPFRRRETEIARIVLASVTQDVYSVRARRLASGRLAYRIVDEYQTTWRLTRQTSARPLSFGELVALIDTADDDSDRQEDGFVENIVWWQLHQGADDPEGFVTVESTVYPELEAYYAERTRRLVERLRAEAPPEDDDGGLDDPEFCPWGGPGAR